MIYAITAAFVLLDMITGIIKAVKEKNFCSSVMREGLFHKAGSVVTVVFGCLVDYAQNYVDLGVKIPVATSICVYIIMMEVGSIMENVCKVNPALLSDKIKSYFAKLTTKEEPKNDN